MSQTEFDLRTSPVRLVGLYIQDAKKFDLRLIAAHEDCPVALYAVPAPFIELDMPSLIDFKLDLRTQAGRHLLPGAMAQLSMLIEVVTASGFMKDWKDIPKRLQEEPLPEPDEVRKQLDLFEDFIKKGTIK